MYDSGIEASKLIDQLQSEVDVAREIPTGSYIIWLNTVEQLLYSEIIRELATVDKTGATSPITLSSLDVSGFDVRFEDVYGVYARTSSDNTSIFNGGGIQLTRISPASARTFDNVYYNVGGLLHFKTASSNNKITVMYFVRPTPKTLVNYTTSNVMVPCEFLDLVKSRLRSEAFKLMNEDGLAAKWMNDYNTLLESFKAWVDARRPRYGV